MEKFPHLRLHESTIGKPRLNGSGKSHPTTLENKNNRKGHSDYLDQKRLNIKNAWVDNFKERENLGLANIDKNTNPIFLQINPDKLDSQFNLESYGIEIISEEEGGFIIGASADGLKTLEDKIKGFIDSEDGTGTIAELWKIFDGGRDVWKPQHILSEMLFAQWNKISDDEVYEVEVSIAFSKPIGKEPDRTKQGGKARHKKYMNKVIERDNLLMQRQDHFEEFINHYGEMISGFVEMEDSFSCQVAIAGKGLKDLVVNYQYVFEVNELEEIGGRETKDEFSIQNDFETIEPEEDASIVGVIDSGIMENHRYLELAIDKDNSISYVDDSTADMVGGGGHGTKVAGAILYPKGVSEVESPYRLPCFLRNLKILDKDNKLLHNYPAELMGEIVQDNEDCKIFNLSVNSSVSYRKKHMSSWAAMLDKLSHDKDLLFVVSAGNVIIPSIKGYLDNNKDYPEFLEELSCKIANPAQSLFSIAVGSINHCDYSDEYWESLGNKDEVSAFSRTGTSIWNSIKPDVVEYGGGLVSSSNGLNQVKQNNETAIELLNSNFDGRPAIGRDTVGTSFAAPKVSYIAARLKQLYPNEHSNVIRSLIAQGARLPIEQFENPTIRAMQHFGYGLPNIERVTKNTEHRITFYNSGNIATDQANLYTLKIPEKLRRPEEDYKVLLEVTLSYSAEVRRTRQKTKSYLSTWLDWDCSKLGESYDQFKEYALKEEDEIGIIYDPKSRKNFDLIPWKINKRVGSGEVKEISRNNCTLQKDWAIINSYDLSEELSFAVRAHKGWDKDCKEIPYALTVSLEILGADIPIYEAIRIENEIEIEV